MNSNETIHTHTRYEAMQLDMNLTQLIDELGVTSETLTLTISVIVGEASVTKEDD